MASSSSTTSSNNNEAPHAVGQLSPFVCACFTLNYIIGTGFLTLPWAFEVGGFGLSAAAMALTCYISTVAADYILNAMARADALMVVTGGGGTGITMTAEGKPLMSGTESSVTANYQAVQGQVDGSTSTKFAVEFDNASISVDDTVNVKNDASYQKLVQEHGRLLVSHRKFELTELVGRPR